MPEAAPNLDPNHGAGGAYVINPETGERELVERTAEAAPAETAPADQPAEE